MALHAVKRYGQDIVCKLNNITKVRHTYVLVYHHQIPYKLLIISDDLLKATEFFQQFGTFALPI